MNLLRTAVQQGLRELPEASRLASLQRCTSLYEQSQPADYVYLIEEGLVKLTRSNASGGRIILAICGPGQMVGEEALSSDSQPHYCEAMTITSATVCRIPRHSVLQTLTANEAIGTALVSYLLERKQELAEKVELLCLHDVEYRILHYLAQLSGLLTPVNGSGFQIPITQLELADLIGATRETTSTTLNQLERRGLLKLSRRLLIVHSPEQLRDAAAARLTATPPQNTAGTAIPASS